MCGLSTHGFFYGWGMYVCTDGSWGCWEEEIAFVSSLTCAWFKLPARFVIFILSANSLGGCIKPHWTREYTYCARSLSLSIALILYLHLPPSFSLSLWLSLSGSLSHTHTQYNQLVLRSHRRRQWGSLLLIVFELYRNNVWIAAVAT